LETLFQRLAIEKPLKLHQMEDFDLRPGLAWAIIPTLFSIVFNPGIITPFIFVCANATEHTIFFNYMGTQV
jgi:hypothetical protein